MSFVCLYSKPTWVCQVTCHILYAIHAVNKLQYTLFSLVHKDAALLSQAIGSPSVLLQSVSESPLTKR